MGCTSKVNFGLGPTATPLPLFERGHLETFIEFWKCRLISSKGFEMLLKEVVMNGEFRRFALQNAMYSAPWIGRRSFLENAARHIFPTMRLEDLEHAKGSGGIRPQLVDLKERKMIFEIGTVSAGRRVLCIVTPSPGATMALDGALEDFVPRALKAIGEGHLMNHQLINRELDS